MKRHLTRSAASAVGLLFLAACSVGAQERRSPELVGERKELLKERKGDDFRPANRQPTDDLLRQFRLPDGFRVNKFADGLAGKNPEGAKPGPRIMAVGDDGTVYATRPRFGDVLALRDTDGDGRADRIDPAVRNLTGVHGITLHRGTMYLTTVGEVYAAEITNGAAGELRKLIDDLPRGEGHHNRTLGVGPDDMLYITVGSTCNCCLEKNSENASVLRASLDGRDRKIFARGLRNTIGFGWHPTTKEMWGMDHGTDWLGDDIPPEELNRLEEGKDYGWPFVWGDRQTIPALESHPMVGRLEDYAAKTLPPVLGYQAHSAPIQMVFYAGQQFSRDYQGDAFVAMHGSWNRKPSVGYEVVRVRFDAEGRPLRFEKFLTGFLIEEGEAFFGRPAGLAVAADGSLLVGDDVNGVIYRVSYQGNGNQ